MVTFFRKNGRKKTVHFGAAGYSDYTKHKDKERKELYKSRHKSREKWTKSGIDTAGFWARWILWNKPSLKGSISYTEDQFNITIEQGPPPSSSPKKKRSKKTSPKKKSPKKKRSKKKSPKKKSPKKKSPKKKRSKKKRSK